MPLNLSSILKHQTEHNSAILDLLLKTTIGTNGARYAHLHTAKKIAELHQPHYFTIYRSERAIVNITICERPMMVGDSLTDTFYIRYFAFDESFQTKSAAKTKSKPSPFQKHIVSLLNTSNLDTTKPEYQPKIYWAIVDPENIRSLQMGERYGFEKVANLKTTAFSRFFPKERKSVQRINTEDQQEVLKKIQTFYKGYNGFTDIHLFKHNNYFVLKENETIVAGIQANKVEWRIDALPGPFGKQLVRILPFIPFIRRIINPKRYSFLATEGLFCMPGHEKRIKDLLEGVLYLQHCNSLLIWSDINDQKIDSLLERINLGILQKVKANNDIYLVAKFNQTSDKTRELMKTQPHYISGFDCT